MRLNASRSSPASWRSGYAEDCKSLHPGSIPGVASTLAPKSSNKIKRLLTVVGHPLRVFLEDTHHYPTPWGRDQTRPLFFGLIPPNARGKPRKLGENFFWSCQTRRARHRVLFLGSSVVEQSAVNRLVGGSSPSRGATFSKIYAKNAPASAGVFHLGQGNPK